MRRESPHTTTRRRAPRRSRRWRDRAARPRPRHRRRAGPRRTSVSGRSSNVAVPFVSRPRIASVPDTRSVFPTRVVAVGMKPTGVTSGPFAVELGRDRVAHRSEQLVVVVQVLAHAEQLLRHACTAARTRRREGTGCARWRSGAGTSRPSTRPCHRPRSTWRRRGDRPRRRRARSPTRNSPGQMNGAPSSSVLWTAALAMSSGGRTRPASGPCDAAWLAARWSGSMFVVCSPMSPGSLGPTSSMRMVASGRASAIVRAYADPAGPLPTISTSTDPRVRSRSSSSRRPRRRSGVFRDDERAERAERDLESDAHSAGVAAPHRVLVLDRYRAVVPPS